MDAATFDQKLRDYAVQNTRLLQTLSETDYAISAGQQNSSYINTLKQQVSGHEVQLKKLASIVSDEYKDHKKYRDAHVRRIAYWVKGPGGSGKEKFQERASKEEREWLEAVSNEIKAQKELDQLRASLADAETTRTELQSIAEVHRATKVELDALYNMLFDGPTPTVPGEDEKENVVRQAEATFNTVQMRLSTENQVKDILLQADTFIQRAVSDIASASSSATADLWGVGGTFSEMAEGSALSRCQSHCSQVEMLMGQANRLQPAVGHIGEMRVVQQDLMFDVVFDNVFADIRMKDQIWESQQQIYAAQKALKGEIGRTQERVQRCVGEARQAGAVLDGRRGELQRVRASAFERLSGGGGGGGGRREQPPSVDNTLFPGNVPNYEDTPPPSYSA